MDIYRGSLMTHQALRSRFTRWSDQKRMYFAEKSYRTTEYKNAWSNSFVSAAVDRDTLWLVILRNHCCSISNFWKHRKKSLRILSHPCSWSMKMNSKLKQQCIMNQVPANPEWRSSGYVPGYVPVCHSPPANRANRKPGEKFPTSQKPGEKNATGRKTL